MGGMNVPDLLSMAASASLPQRDNGSNNATTIGPAPLAMPAPPPRFQPPQIEYGKAGNEFQTVSGRKRADTQALLHGIAQTVKAGADYVQAKKNRTLQSSIERMMSAQQGITEAQQMLQQNPNDPRAKEAIATNTAIINDITADPKINKQLQKAFNIDLFGNGKNKNENKALMDAWKGFQQKQQAGDKTALNPIAQRLMQQQPQRQQIDPQILMQMQLIKAGVNPNANELLKANTETQKAILSAKSSQDRSVVLDKAAKDRADAIRYHADKLVDAANTKVLGQQAAAEIRARSEVYRANMTAATWDKRIALLNSVQGKNTNAKVMFGQAKQYNDELKSLITENTKNQAELDKKGSSLFGIKLSAASGPDAQILRNKITTNNLRMQFLQKQLDGVNQKVELLNKLGVMQINESSGDSGGNRGGDNDGDDTINVTEEDMK